MLSIQTYEQFLARKSVSARPAGFDPGVAMPKAMKPFQRDITTWACRRGRAAVFAGTGLGKTLMELSWAENVVDQAQGQVLLFTPLAVAEQTVLEAAKFGVAGVAYAPDQGAAKTPIVVTNYDRRDKFDVSKFAGIVLDESGIIKDHDSRTRRDLTDACRGIPYLLCGSATPAPNDWTELGQHAEFLGVISAKEMLAMFFVHDGAVRADANGEEWRLKGHAKEDFWRWVASWSVMIRHPRDLGYEDAGYDLPPLTMHQVTVSVGDPHAGGTLFPQEAQTLQERIRARKDTITDRVAAVYELIVDDWACGSQNTISASAPSTTWIQSTDSACSNNQDSGAESIIGPTIRPIKTNGRTGASARKSGSARTNCAASNGPRMSNTEVGSLGGGPLNTKREAVKTLGDGRREFIASTDLSTSNSLQSCKSKGGDAPYANTRTKTRTERDCTSTTAIEQERSGDCFAESAIPASGSSETAQIVSPAPFSMSPAKDRWLIWCNLNSEQDALEKLFGDLCFSVYGSLSHEEKVRRVRGWLAGERPVILSKPSITGRGLNMQCASKMAFCGLTDSFEQVFQAIRRCWRFGQTREVDVYMVAAETEGAVVKNLQNKERKYEAMADAMAAHMVDLSRAAVRGGRISASTYEPNRSMELPAWLQ